jgi:hypothetical protein
MADIVLHLEGSVTVDVAEYRMLGLLGKSGSTGTEPLVIDLANVAFLEVVAGLYLLSAIRTFLAEGREVQIRLPSKDEDVGRRVRDFLRVWSFPEAAEVASGRRFRELVAEEDHRFFYEGIKYYPSGAKWLPPSENPSSVRNRSAARALAELERTRFFGFIPHDLATASPVGIIEEEWGHWRGDLVSSVLGHYLGDDGSEMPRDVIQELLLNAVRHPQAKMMMIVSGVNRDRDENPTALTVSVWDDGEGVVETLRGCLDEQRSIRVTDVEEHEHFHLKAKGWEPAEPVIDPKTWVSDRCSDQELLLASMFQGITRRAESTSDNPELDLFAYEGIGEGLFHLYQSVIGHLGGSIAVRTGNFFMNLRANKSGARSYHAMVADYRQHGWPPFQGNMFTVRVPFRR